MPLRKFWDYAKENLPSAFYHVFNYQRLTFGKSVMADSFLYLFEKARERGIPVAHAYHPYEEFKGRTPLDWVQDTGLRILSNLAFKTEVGRRIMSGKKRSRIKTVRKMVTLGLEKHERATELPALIAVEKSTREKLTDVTLVPQLVISTHGLVSEIIKKWFPHTFEQLADAIAQADSMDDDAKLMGAWHANTLEQFEKAPELKDRVRVTGFPVHPILLEHIEEDSERRLRRLAPGVINRVVIEEEPPNPQNKTSSKQDEEKNDMQEPGDEYKNVMLSPTSGSPEDVITIMARTGGAGGEEGELLQIMESFAQAFKRGEVRMVFFAGDLKGVSDNLVKKAKQLGLLKHIGDVRKGASIQIIYNQDPMKAIREGFELERHCDLSIGKWSEQTAKIAAGIGMLGFSSERGAGNHEEANRALAVDELKCGYMLGDPRKAYQTIKKRLIEGDLKNACERGIALYEEGMAFGIVNSCKAAMEAHRRVEEENRARAAN